MTHLRLASVAFAAVVCGLFLSMSASHAATFTWTGGSSDWTLGTNWSPAGPPTAADTAILPAVVPANQPDTNTGAATCLILQVNGAYTISGTNTLAVAS